MYRVAVLGHQEITKIFVDQLVKSETINLVLGLSLDPKIAIASDHVDLKKYYVRLGCKFEYLDDYSLLNSRIEKILLAEKIDFICVVGWSRLIPAPLVEDFNFIGWHGGVYPPPRCRGRAGINWALINRHKTLYYYTMKLDSGVDTGSVLDQSHLSINEHDTVRTVYLKLGFELVALFLESFTSLTDKKGFVKSKAEEYQSYLPGRLPEDSLINWLQSDIDVDHFVRALCFPYPCAYTFLENGERFEIHSGRPLGNITGLTLKPGEVYADLIWGGVMIGCAKGIYLAENFECETDIAHVHGSVFEKLTGKINPTIKY